MYVKIKGKPSLYLSSNNLSVKGDNLVSSTGVLFHLPRSVKRALASEKAGRRVKPFQFLLQEVPTKVGNVRVKINSNKVAKAVRKSVESWWNTNGPQVSKLVPKIVPAKPKFILTGDVVSFFHNGQSYSTSRANPMFETVVTHLKSGNTEKSVELVNIANTIDAASQGVIKNQGGSLKFNNMDLNETVQDWLIKNMGSGKPAVNAVVNFLGRVKNNPNPGSIEQLWRFLKTHDLILLPDGRMIAYKYVRADFKDQYSGTMDNSVGKEVTMPRESVTYDPNQTCSSGLHFASWEYLSSKPNIVEVLVCPSDVVSIPTDAKDMKARCCKYFVWKLLRHNGIDIAERTKQFFDLAL